MENGTRHGVIGGVMSAAALVISCVAIAICLGIRVDIKTTAYDASREVEVVKEEKVVEAVKTEEKTAKYKAEIEEGYVVVRDAGGTVVKTLGTPVRFMTDGDREYFAAGVEIFTDDELAAICDDFGN
ncbi:MAG: hypothetical protein IKP68_09380 [Clostridia bacterium]|nr:hypothetical protein [Clostridia bacterium]